MVDRLQAAVQQTQVKKSFILTYRGPDFTQQLCEQHFPNFEINHVKARTVDRTGTKMIFVRHGRQLRVSQWISAVEDYNKEAPVHLKIHWAGSTETEHIRQSEGHSRLSISHAYKYILQKDNTYMEWATVSLSGKGPLKPFVDAPGDPSGASSKRNPKRVYENMNVDKIYRDMTHSLVFIGSIKALQGHEH